ncbi:type II secretion system F family protein [Sphingorhabdus sp. Alg239-R122]|uniref:type II secretion system F family protein n=1 Tax=Sphingorhabdus sp. Alg239-R122 TaxID=2305989 RepID=UPI001F07B090|nr:type II secretion system F family protein [Sphingorhabdus sp. Alg239-R122]
MPDILQYILLVTGIVSLAALLIFAFSGPSKNKIGARRLHDMKLRHSDSTQTTVEAQMRKAVAARKPRMVNEGEKQSRIDILANRIHMTGKSWTIAQYAYVSLGIAITFMILVYTRSGNLMLSSAVGIMLGLGLPHLVIGFLIKRRVNQFTSSFPDAIELLVRGLRSGLPVTETLTVVAQEIEGPVGEEFKSVTERIKIGRSMDEALEETAKKLGTPEFNFFCITIAIQRETGGNLAETLANLADVLRKRSQMKLKIRAMSSESKASAYIVGALPFIVFGMVWWINPTYLGGFFTDDRLIIAGLGGAVWMSIGAFIMAKMVNFEI